MLGIVPESVWINTALLFKCTRILNETNDANEKDRVRCFCWKIKTCHLIMVCFRSNINLLLVHVIKRIRNMAKGIFSWFRLFQVVGKQCTYRDFDGT